MRCRQTNKDQNRLREYEQKATQLNLLVGDSCHRSESFFAILNTPCIMVLTSIARDLRSVMPAIQLTLTPNTHKRYLLLY